ncbi:hypothetical protein [Hyalangium gracile]|uniref:hypothetical protein n=1 Tax=Hyalangium gracile TaxID=394092 RepID=UPI001CCE3351|nr:hypothetical protein [Hyalangium gracile]
MTETNGTQTSAVPSTLAEARVLMLQCVARDNAEHYRLGCLYNQVVDKGLAGTFTEESARRYFAPWIKTFSMSDLHMYGTVAREFPEEICRKYGMKPLRLLMAYAKRFRLSVVGKDPGPLLIRVPQADGTMLYKPFHACSREEVGRAMTGRVPTEDKGFGTVPGEELHRLQSLRDGMQKHFPENSSARLRAAARDGQLQITLRNVSVAELELLMAAIYESREHVFQEQISRPVEPLSEAVS